MADDYTPTKDRIVSWLMEGAYTGQGADHRAEAFDAWLAEHDAKVRAEALREFAGVVREVAALGPENTGLRKPAHLEEYAANYADRIEREAGLK